MKKNDTLHGFTVQEVRALPELEATIVEMEHVKSGARLVWLDRPDENKTFCIAFRTLPEDDTGVFHILEHSVLCGSEKYQVKEPFVELMKGSMNTFLNAFTFPDKTCYPVSSRNDKDFLNLTRVYMDAVLHPLIYHKPEIFHQEGWHYELPKDGGTPSYKGVVFNEMKGAYSTPETIMVQQILRSLFPDTYYGFESGGNPRHIPELSYEQFLNSHRRFYHPSNSYIILDGQMDIAQVLGILDGEYLAAYDRRTDLPEFVIQKAVKSGPVQAYYESSPSEPQENRARLAWATVLGTYEDREARVAISAIADALCGGSQSPLKQKIISAGLGQDVLMSVEADLAQMCVFLEVRNMDGNRADEVNTALRQELERLVREGLDHRQIEASLASLEFRMRERDYGWSPQGLGLTLEVLESWLYGGDPAANLQVGDLFTGLAKKLEEGYFEKLLEQVLLQNPHSCEVLLLPSTTLGEEQRAAEVKRLESAAAAWSEEERAALVREQEALEAWQASSDSPEALASIPALRLSDIPDKPEDIPTEVGSLGDVPLLTHAIPTGGIGYFNLYFDITDLTEEQLSQTALLCTLMGELDTDQYSGLALQRLRRLLLGGLALNVEPCGRTNAPEDCRTYLSVSFSALESKLGEAAALVANILTGSRLDDGGRIQELLHQTLSRLDQGLIGAGHEMAMGRVVAGATVEGAVAESTGGIAYYQWLKALEREFDGRREALLQDLSALRKRIFTTGRLTIGLTGLVDAGRAALDRLLPQLPAESRTVLTCAVKPWGVRREGIIIPAGVSFAAIGGDLLQCGAPHSGTLRVARRVIGLQYLWNAIRVQGGAYGAGMMVKRTGGAAFYSYRDPSAARSLEKYRESAAFLRSFCEEKPDLTGMITGAAAAADPLMMPSKRGRTADLLYLRGVTYEDRCQEQREILAATPEALAALAEPIGEISRTGSVCVIGSKAHIEACGQELESVISL